MLFYAFHLSDYALDTNHLSNIEDLAYRRMLDLYYHHEKPLSGDAKSIARKIRLPDHVSEVQNLLDEFFEQKGEKWHNVKCDQEIKKVFEMKTRNQEAGRASASARKLKKEREENRQKLKKENNEIQRKNDEFEKFIDS